MKLSEYIKNYRKANKMTLQEFADKAGLSKGYRSQLEHESSFSKTGKQMSPSIVKLKQIADAIDNKLDNAFILLANINGTSVNLIAKSSSKVNAGTIVKEISLKCNGNGGGSPKFAQGGGNNATDIAEYLAEVKEQIKNM